jgi:hypothetical protein
VGLDQGWLLWLFACCTLTVFVKILHIQAYAATALALILLALGIVSSNSAFQRYVSP